MTTPAKAGEVAGDNTCKGETTPAKAKRQVKLQVTTPTKAGEVAGDNTCKGETTPAKAKRQVKLQVTTPAGARQNLQWQVKLQVTTPAGARQHLQRWEKVAGDNTCKGGRLHLQRRATRPPRPGHCGLPTTLQTLRISFLRRYLS
ncbi:hypothetical protein EXU57_23480 [Segetibacter sp. 3557_3]|uniref:hypothetical protein n=1 Tax=Segetibacter sp. 3557_3 TaxID=2547429 RepID=UPI001058F12A|nr:hypothetical protein [Segetibacter sp. 3557_3]TDH18427.1 hypothetical protein EXU57_23480 [Segetibacter sp. 3557_3]